MKKFFLLFVLVLCPLTSCLIGCTSGEETVVNEGDFTPEQAAQQQAYVDEMDGPPPKE